MKKIIIILLIVILVPLIALAGLYFTFSPFRDMANDILATVPGPIGDNFRNMPTDAEIQAQVEEVANYLLKSDKDRAVDKLLLAESHDRETYDLLIKHMNRLDPNKTAKLMEEIRKTKLKDSPIIATIDKIQEEEAEMNKMDADYISNLSLPSKVEAVRRILDEEINAHKRLAKIFENVSESSVVDVLSYLDEEDRNMILREVDKQKALEYKKKLYDKKERVSNLGSTARLLKAKPADELSSTIGTSSAYSQEELVQIYTTFGPKKAGEVLSKIDDQEFVDKLISDISDREVLMNGVDTFTENLIDALNIYKGYDDKMNELVSTYREMDDAKVAKTVKTLYWNTGISKTYSLNNGEEIVISDEDLALDLLRSFPPKKIASILSYLDNRIASDIFTKLALPETQ